MNVQQILEGLEALFAKQDIQAVEPYLTKQLEQAYSEPDYGACITIMNEMIGFFRDTSQYQKSLDYSEQVLMLMQQMGYEGTLPYATTSLNVANALRAAGLHKESLAFYKSIFPIYQENLEERLIPYIAEQQNISLEDAMDIYYHSKLAEKIHQGTEGIQYLDYKVLAEILMETEAELFAH